MSILIRADSSFEIGTGHMMRDLVLAKQFKKDNVIFATRNLPGNINEKIKKEGYKIKKLNTNSLEELQNVLKNLDIDMLIIDHYEIDYGFEKRLKEQKSGLKLMVLDDLYDKHYCDILLNHNIYADSKKYKGLVPEFCELRCGEKYMLIRDEFIKAKKFPKKRNEKFTIFLAMGGADTANMNIKILEILKRFDIWINVVTTSANKNLVELKEYCKNNKSRIRLYVDSENVAEIMRNSDFAVVTPSVILNEVFFMGIPFLSIKTAQNQNEMVKYLKESGYLVMDSFDGNELFSILKNEIKEYE